MGSVHKLLRLRKALSLSLSLPEQNPLGRSLFGDQDATPDGLPPAAAVGGGKGPLLLRLRLLGDQRAFSALFRLRNAGGQHPPVRKALQHRLSGSRLFRGRTLSVRRSLSVGKPGRSGLCRRVPARMHGGGWLLCCSRSLCVPQGQNPLLRSPVPKVPPQGCPIAGPLSRVS